MFPPPKPTIWLEIDKSQSLFFHIFISKKIEFLVRMLVPYFGGLTQKTSTAKVLVSKTKSRPASCKKRLYLVLSEEFESPASPLGGARSILLSYESTYGFCLIILDKQLTKIGRFRALANLCWLATIAIP